VILNGAIRPRRSPPGGFTLLELLVVMSIISLLMTILLPALSHARDRSRDLKCRSNLHQIGLAIGQYSADWFDIVPREGIAPWYDGFSGYEYIPWIEAIRKYIISGPREQLASPVYLDPAHPNPNHLVHYVMNGMRIPIERGRFQFTDANRRPAGPSSQIRFPDRMIYMTEFTDDRDNSIAKEVHVWNLKQAAGVYDVWNEHHIFGKDTNSDPQAIYVRRIGPNRHGHNNNVMFIDSHVDPLPSEELLKAQRWADGS